MALTHHGLIALGLDPETAGLFCAEFVDGMTAPHRSRWLGDTGESAPANWHWGGPGNPVVGWKILQVYNDGLFSEMAALCVLLVLISGTVVVSVLTLARGRRRMPLLSRRGAAPPS